MPAAARAAAGRDAPAASAPGELRRGGPYTSIGGYPLFWLVSDGETLSFDACKANCGRIARAIRDGLNDGWRVIGRDINWEDRDMHCADTGSRIESAYAEKETES